MEITIFKEITTEGVITSIEENSKKYHEGFYADMNNAPERKLVKESAAEIGDIIKTLKTSRIKITKENTAKVNKEHDSIVARLEAANLPFTLLIDEYKEKRAKILADEKRVIELRELAEQKEGDHEIGLLMNKTYEFDKAEDQRLADFEREIMLQGAKEQAEECQRLKNLEIEQHKINAENARLADVEHVRKINRTAFSDLLGECQLTGEQTKSVITAIIKNKISNITINY